MGKAVEVTVKTVILKNSSFLNFLGNDGRPYLIDRRQAECDNQAWRNIRCGSKLNLPASELFALCAAEPLIERQAPLQEESYQWICLECQKRGNAGEFGDELSVVIRKAAEEHDKSSKKNCKRINLHLYMLLDGSLKEIDRSLIKSPE